MNVLRLESKFGKNEVLKPNNKIIDVFGNHILCDAASKVSLYFIHQKIEFRYLGIFQEIKFNKSYCHSRKSIF